MNLVATTSELSGDVFGQKFCITSGHKYIHIILAEIAVQNSFKAVKHLNFIKQQIIHSLVYNLGTDICHEFFRVNATLFFFNLNKALANQIEIICGVKGKAKDMVSIYAMIQQVMVKKVIQQIGLAASANAGNDFYQSIMFPFYQFIQIEISANLHGKASVRKIFAT